MIDNCKDLFPKKNEDVTNQTHGPADQNYRNSETFAVQYSNNPLTSIGSIICSWGQMTGIGE